MIPAHAGVFLPMAVEPAPDRRDPRARGGVPQRYEALLREVSDPRARGGVPDRGDIAGIPGV